jgi:hypothetical protein
MSGCAKNSTPSHSSTSLKSAPMDNQRLNRKCDKRKAEEVNLVLGDGVKLNEITLMESASLVGHFANRRMTSDAMKS